MEHGVRFLVIGGQARAIWDSYVTRDLDLWVEFNTMNLMRASHAYDAWADKYETHVSPAYVGQLPNAKRNTQVFIPDDDVIFPLENGHVIQIDEHSKTDMLFGIHLDERDDEFFFGCL
jgi:hypothetical protein